MANNPEGDETNEFQRILKLGHWVHGRWPVDNDENVSGDAFAILEKAKTGCGFNCSHSMAVQQAVFSAMGYLPIPRTTVPAALRMKGVGLIYGIIIPINGLFGQGAILRLALLTEKFFADTLTASAAYRNAGNYNLHLMERGNASMSSGRVIVVGGGVIGAACAYFLKKSGWDCVTVLDRGQFGQGCSHGNCGFVSPSHVLPLTVPGAISQSLKALVSSNSLAEESHSKQEGDQARLLLKVVGMLENYSCRKGLLTTVPDPITPSAPGAAWSRISSVRTNSSTNKREKP